MLKTGSRNLKSSFQSWRIERKFTISPDNWPIIIQIINQLWLMYITKYHISGWESIINRIIDITMFKITKTLMKIYSVDSKLSVVSIASQEWSSISLYPSLQAKQWDWYGPFQRVQSVWAQLTTLILNLAIAVCSKISVPIIS